MPKTFYETICKARLLSSFSFLLIAADIDFKDLPKVYYTYPSSLIEAILFSNFLIYLAVLFQVEIVSNFITNIPGDLDFSTRIKRFA